MGRPRHTSNFKPQAKTANIRRIAPGGFAHYQSHGQQRSFTHAQKVDACSAKIAAEEQYHGASSPMFNLPSSSPSEALMNSATEFLNSVLLDLCVMDAPMLMSSVSVDFMDCDLISEELMNVDDDPTLDYMDVDVIFPDVEGSLTPVPMDVDDVIYSPILIDSVLPSPIASPDFPPFTDLPFSPPRIGPATPKCDMNAELSVSYRELTSIVRHELASTNEALQRVSELVSRSAVEQAMGVAPRRLPDIVQSANKFLLPLVDTTCAHDNLAQCGLFIDSSVAFVAEGIRVLDLSDEQAPVLQTSSEGHIPSAAAAPASQDELPPPSSDSSGSFQELSTFDTADLLGLYSHGPLHLTPVNGDNGKPLEALDILADIAGLQDLYANLPIHDLPDDPLTTFPWVLAEEVVGVFDPPPFDRQTHPTGVVDVLPRPEAKVNETLQNVPSEIKVDNPIACTPCEPSTDDVVQALDCAPCEAKVSEDGKLESKISSKFIIQIMKDRAEKDAKKKARNARAQLRRRLVASPRPTAVPGSPNAILPFRSVAQAISASTPALESPLPKTAGTNDPKVEAPPIPDTSNTAAFNRSPRRIASNSRLASPNKLIRSEPSQANSPILPLDIGKENIPPAMLKTRSSPSTILAITKNVLGANSTALSSSPLSTINQNVQHVSKISSALSSSCSPINKESAPATVLKAASSGNISVTTCTRSSPSLPPLIASVKSANHTLEPCIVYLPRTHAMMRERNMRFTPLSTPTSTLCPARNPDFFASRTKYVLKCPGAYLCLYSFQSKTSPREVARSRPKIPTETPAAIPVNTTEAQPVISQGMVLYSPIDLTPDFIVTKAAKVKVLPGAFPTTDYHEDIELPVCRPDYQPTWLQRLRLHIFGW